MTSERTRPTLRLSGDVDMLSADSVIADGRALLAAAGAGASLLVDLGEVSFLDSAGLSALVQLRLEATASGGEVMLTAVPDRVTTLLRIAGLAELFPTQ